jgi:hypothetical protein
MQVRRRGLADRPAGQQLRSQGLGGAPARWQVRQGALVFRLTKQEVRRRGRKSRLPRWQVVRGDLLGRVAKQKIRRSARERPLTQWQVSGRGLDLDSTRWQVRKYARIAQKTGRRSGARPASPSARRTPPEHLHLPMGSRRTRSRLCSNTTIAPASRSASTTERLARSSWSCRLGRRSVPWRNRIAEGSGSSRAASSVPKSVSAETTMREVVEVEAHYTYSNTARAGRAVASAMARAYRRTCSS